MLILVLDLAVLMFFWINNQVPYFRLQLKEKIEKLEKANLAQKPWQMSGEAGGRKRPINSLLEEDVSFDHTTTTGKKYIQLVMKLNGGSKSRPVLEKSACRRSCGMPIFCQEKRGMIC